MYYAIVHCGRHRSPAPRAGDDALRRALAPLRSADRSGEWADDRVSIRQSITWNTPESHAEEAPSVCPSTGRVIASWARLDNRAELLRSLQLVGRSERDTTDSQIILAAYDRWGVDCVEHLIGDFSFVIYDPRTGELVAARDPLGVRPLFIAEAPFGLVFATTAAVFPVVPGLRLTPSEEWVARFVAGVSMSHVETAWHEVRKLESGHVAIVDTLEADRPTVREQRYFEFVDDQPSASRQSDVWVEQYRDLLDEAVRCRLRTSYPLGAETSGGIDSSTCVGLAAALWTRSRDELHTYGYVLCEDEPEFISETGRMFGLQNETLWQAGSFGEIVTPMSAKLDILGYPDEHGSGWSHTIIYEACAAAGVRTLLSGFGGDEVVTNSGSLLPKELFDQRAVGALLRTLHGNPVVRPLRLARLAQRELLGRRWSAPGHLESVVEGRWQGLLRHEIAERYQLESAVRFNARYDSVHRTINGFALDRLGSPFVPTRLENCSILAQAHGVDYRWPLLDVRLIQQYLSTPAVEKAQGAMGRYLHRRAIEGVVPSKVQWKQMKSMGGPIRPLPTPDRDVGPASRLEALRRDLHPMLENVVDLGRSTRAGDLDGPTQDGARVLQRQIEAVGSLNAWLVRHHA